MACKYYRSGAFCDYCKAKGSEERVTYAHAKEFCKCANHEKCNAFKATLGGWFSGLFGL